MFKYSLTDKPAAYSGRYCDVDVDGCADLSCFDGVECLDIPAPGVGAMCGPCPDGFNGNGMKCTGIIENFHTVVGTLEHD